MKRSLSKSALVVRHFSFAVWVMVVLGALIFYLSNPSAFTAENIASALKRFQGWIWIIYLVFSALRGFTLLPSTPLVLAGTVLFPDQPYSVFAIALTGILVSSSMIYYFSEFLGFDEYFEDHNPELTHKIKARLEHPLGFLFVALWAFFPLVPTDLVCYLAGSTRMNFIEFIAAIAAGEAVLCYCYIFLGRSILGQFLRPS